MQVAAAGSNVDRHDSEGVASRIAGFLKHYGSNWPAKSLVRSVLLVNCMDYGSWMYRHRAEPYDKELDLWQLEATNQVML